MKTDKRHQANASIKKINESRTSAKEKRVRWCVNWLRKGWKKYQIKDAVRRFAGEELSARTIDSYISEAKAQLREDYGGTREEHREDSYLFRREIRDNPENSARDRLKAQDGIDDLLGLKVQSNNTNESEHKHVHFHQHNELNSDEATEIIAAVLDRAEAGRIGEGTNGTTIPVTPTQSRNGSTNGKPPHTGNGDS